MILVGSGFNGLHIHIYINIINMYVYNLSLSLYIYTYIIRTKMVKLTYRMIFAQMCYGQKVD